jgi:hypothetical protein
MKTLNLMVHAGGMKVERAQVDEVLTPVATQTWHPIPHKRFIDGVISSLDRSGLHVVSEAHALGRDGQRYFGMFQLRNGNNPADYSLVVGLRNSHDKSFPAGLVVGSGVFVCDNLAFSGEIQIGRKHTTHIERDLPELMQSAVGRIGDLRKHQDNRIDAYKRFEMSDTQAHDIVIQALDTRVAPVTYIPEILKEWRAPRHPEFAVAKNGWRLFNAFTEVLKASSLFERPRATQALHGLMDTACGVGKN